MNYRKFWSEPSFIIFYRTNIFWIGGKLLVSKHYTEDQPPLLWKVIIVDERETRLDRFVITQLKTLSAIALDMFVKPVKGGFSIL